MRKVRAHSAAGNREAGEHFLEEVLFKQVRGGHVEIRQAKGAGFWNELRERFR